MVTLFYGVGGIVVAGVGLLLAFQEKLVYVPVLPGLSKSYPITPARFNLIYEDVWLQSADGVRLHAWFIKMFPECRDQTTNTFSLDCKMRWSLHFMLYAKAAARNPPFTFVEFPIWMHMDTWLSGGDIYWKTNLQFLEEHAPDKKGKMILVKIIV